MRSVKLKRLDQSENPTAKRELLGFAAIELLEIYPWLSRHEGKNSSFGDWAKFDPTCRIIAHRAIAITTDLDGVREFSPNFPYDEDLFRDIEEGWLVLDEE